MDEMFDSADDENRGGEDFKEDDVSSYVYNGNVTD
jgi:hypothetical protein